HRCERRSAGACPPRHFPAAAAAQRQRSLSEPPDLAASMNGSPHSRHATGPYPSRRFIVRHTGHGPLLKPLISASSAITRRGQDWLSPPTHGIAAAVGSPPEPTHR